LVAATFVLRRAAVGLYPFLYAIWITGPCDVVVFSAASQSLAFKPKIDTIVIWREYNRNLIQVALVNLLGNAWKFTSKTAHPRVEVGRKHDADSVFFVRDNGSGFDMSTQSISPFAS
jgi:C4-dicarboxylate-specific signal transduction histidine kinase